MACARRLIETLNAEIETVDQGLAVVALTHPACRSLCQLYGIGPVLAVTLLAELGDVRRFRNGRQVVRSSGLDITVEQSDTRRRPGKLARQGSPVLRWAAVEAVQRLCRRHGPDHAAYQRLKARLGAQRASLALARKLLKRAYHQLREVDRAAMRPAA